MEDIKPQHEERPHAERSASQLSSLLMCPGYQPRKTGDRVHWVTAQGTRGHEALDTGDTGELESDFEARMVSICEAYSAKFVELGSQVYNEFRVDTVEGRWGYCDRLIINADGTAHLLDWKFVRAKEVTDATINLQGKDYVVGILKDSRFANIERISVHFVMPRFGSVTRSDRMFTRSDIPALSLEIYAVLSRARQTDSKKWRGASLTPYYDVCKYCGVSGRCVALRRIADDLGRKYDPDGYGKKPALPVQTHASEITDLGARAQLQELASLMETWSTSVRHHNLTAALDNPENVPTGYILDWVKGRRRVTSADGLLLVAQEFGITPQELIDAASLSWTKVETVLKDKAARGQKGMIVSQWNERLVEIDAVERPEPTPKLVRARPARV
jgi:hypothetical protein